MSELVSRSQCPECQAKGKDLHSSNLHNYADGSIHCHACGYHNYKNSKQNFKEAEPIQKIMFNQSDFNKLDFNSHPWKPFIHKGFLKKSGTRISYNTTTGFPEGVHYPYYHPTTHKQLAEKVRLPPDSEPRFYCKGRLAECGLYRQNITSPHGRMLIITEGEDDADALDHLLRRAGKDYNIVSLPNGANLKGTTDKQVLAQDDYLSSFETVVFCLDNDEAGTATAVGMAEWLCNRTKVKICPVTGFKDAYELLESCQGIPEQEVLAGKAFTSSLWNTQEYRPDDVIDGRNLTVADIKRPPLIGYPLPWPELQQMLKGFRPGEITLLCAGPGVGKSTLSRAIAYHFRKNIHLNIANIFLEDGWQKAAQAYVAYDWKIPLHVLRSNPDILTDDQVAQSMKELFWNGGIYFHKHWGSIQRSRLISKLRYYALSCKCLIGILDHLSIVISGNESRDERKDIDILMTRLAGLTVETQMHVLAIVHLKRKGQGQSFNEGAPISINDLRGSSSLEGLSDNIIAAERDQQAQGTKGDTLCLRLLKNREIGTLGPCGSLYYQAETGLLIPV